MEQPLIQPAYKIMVNENGVYRLTYADLQAVGIPVDNLDPRTFRVFNQGIEAAVYITGELDGSFDEGDLIIFYGRKISTKHTGTNVYWLCWGGDAGMRMSISDGIPTGSGTVPTSFQTTRRVEEDHLYNTQWPSGSTGDHWYWEYILASSPDTSSSYSITLPHPSPESVTATVRGLLKGYNTAPPDQQHHTLIYVNRSVNTDPIADDYWASTGDYVLDVDVPQSFLVPDGNILTVEIPLDGLTSEMLYTNWFEIDYYRTYTADGDVLFFDGDQAGTWEFRVDGFSTDLLEVYDITAPASPVRVINAGISTLDGINYKLAFEQTLTAEQHYLALASALLMSPPAIEEDTPSNLLDPSNSADYILITHEDFSSSVQPLADHREAQGLRTVVVDVQDIYDEFSHGIFDPGAIHEFLAYAYANWLPPAPVYVLLVGDGNYDFKDNLGRGEPNYIPPYLADVDPWIGEVPTDNRYVCVTGEDILPDMYIGRLPVKTAAEAGEMVTKILNYEQSPPAGSWGQRILFAADDPDAAGDFHALSNDIADNYLPAPYTPDKVYYGLTHPTPAGAKSAIINAINEGRLMVNYTGHAATQSWAAERLFEISDIASLSNGGRMPVMVPMTALDGYFVHPSQTGTDLSSLGETVVRVAGAGAVASWSPAGLGVAAGHDYLNRGLYQALFFDGVTRLGQAAAKAKLYLYRGGAYRDLIDTYTLFGDPALKLHRDYSALILERPNGGTAVPSGSVYNIEWGDPGGSDSYKLLFSRDNGNTWSKIVKSITGNLYRWNVPIPPWNRRKCLIKVIAYDPTGAKMAADQSDANFVVEVVKLTSPDGGETLSSGGSHTITWTTNATRRKVRRTVLKYTRNRDARPVRWRRVKVLKGNPGTFSWDPVAGVSSTRTSCRVKVILRDRLGRKLGADASDRNFTLMP